MREELRTANEMAATERQKVVELERTLTTRDAKVDELKAVRGDAKRKLAEFRRYAELEMELTTQNAELECYRALDAERAKWETREQRVLEQLETTRHELDKHGVGLMYATLRAKLITVEGQLQVATDELESNRTVVVQQQTEKDAVCLEREAEVVLLQARLRRMEHLGATLESEETHGASSPTTPT